MHTLIHERLEDIADLCRRFAVRRLEVFGSAARGEDFDPATSDADFLVSFDETAGAPSFTRVLDLAEGLEAILGRSVDLLDRKTLEKSRNHIRRRSILADAQTVYG
jgi:predicted nucleotidyltransferase